MEPTPTAPLDRNNDRVYDSTTSVVRAVMSLSQGVQAHQANLYLDLVKKVCDTALHSSDLINVVIYQGWSGAEGVVGCSGPTHPRLPLQHSQTGGDGTQGPLQRHE